MIINLWSTPRTGSIWYSFYLRQKYSNSTLLNELFNRYHMNMYHTDEIGHRTNVYSYSSGSYHNEYYILDKAIAKKKIYSERQTTLEQEESYRLNLLNETKNNIDYVLHNHVEPMNIEIKKYLLAVGTNVYIYRKDRRAQLGSYAIAYATKQFAKFKMIPESTEVITEFPFDVLNGLLTRIKIWDEMEKNGPVIAYEDINFEQIDGWPVKQVSDYRTRLNSNILKWIDTAVGNYEESRQIKSYITQDTI